ncbi:unnamed protein product [Discula destructiva]
MAQPGEAGDTAADAFQQFDKVLPENCVDYMLFVTEPQSRPREALSSLETVRRAAVQLCNQLTKDYIWQREAFRLETKSSNGLHYLHGITDYGDSVEDEWLVVYILRELTKQFPNLWARVSDSDGEFLLVEAANVLPKWLSPENDANRAWLHSGQLRLIPLQLAADALPNSITLHQAVHLLETASGSLLHSTLVEAEALYRLEKYPDQIHESLHYALVTVPRRLAYILHELPQTISPAVEAFYLRDPIALRPLLEPMANGLLFPTDDLVELSVKFTKVLYAQLKSQQFSPPPGWQSIFTASELGDSSDSNGSAHRKQSMIDLGMKVTCGFEMLAVGAAKNKNRTAREFAILLDDLAQDGDSGLPSDTDIAAWADSAREDDDAWMDINFEDFERELKGKHSKTKDKGGGFGDPNTQADLRKIVSRFEAFLNDDKAGIDGAEFDGMDEDDDELGSDGEESDGEDRDVSFDEEEFALMMREMMGLPAGSRPGSGITQGKRAALGADTLEEDSEDEEIRQLSEQMAVELTEHGALELEPTPKELKRMIGKGKGKAEAADQHGSEDEGVDIDYNLAKNLLESFKGQAGVMGPVGTMLADMGLRLPRDEDDDNARLQEDV